MSDTRIICEGCGFTRIFCQCGEAESSRSPVGSIAWSEEPPTEEGWYWIDGPELSEPIIDYVGVRPGHKYLAIQTDEGYQREFYAVVSFPDTKWAGPIPMPKQ